jgi:methionyl-tRNA formyltransferase
MNIVFFASSGIALPTLREMVSRGFVCGICLPAKAFDSKQHFIDMATSANVPLIEAKPKELQGKVKNWLLKLKPDFAFVLTFSYKIPAPVLNAVNGGFYNIHFGTLPEYRGPEPVFWQMKNQEQEIGITVHKMDENWDTGPIVLIDRVPVAVHEVYGTLQSKLAQMAVATVGKLLTALTNNAIMELPQKSGVGNYYSKPGYEDVLIDWENDDSKAIQALVRATNPWNKGAVTYIRGMMLKVIAVSEIQANGLPDSPAGTLLDINERPGTYVITKDKKLLSLDIIYLEEGFVTGLIFKQFGLQPGERFTKSPEAMAF